MSDIINEGLVDPQYIEKCEIYVGYIDEHIANVKLAYNKLFCNPDKPFTNFHGIQGEKLKRILAKLEMAINCHDSSKYLDSEFEGYRNHFYPTVLEQERMKEDEFYAKLVESNYQTSWFNHFVTNDHHPLHWKWTTLMDTKAGKQIVALKTPLKVARKMTPLAILHMICDWEAMSIKFNGSTVQWYINDAVDERRDMNPETRKIVEELLTQLYGVEIPAICKGDKSPDTVTK